MAHGSQYVTLGIDREVFAIPVERVQEILDMREPARLPEAPAYLLGMIDVRGRGIPVLDLRTKIGLPRAEPTPSTRIVVLDLAGAGGPTGIGLVADCVFEVTALDGALEAPPAVGGKWRPEYVAGIGRRGEAFVVALDLDRLLGGDAPMLQAVA